VKIREIRVSTGKIKIGTTHEIMASGTAQFALLIDQLMAALQTETPMFARMIGGLGGTGVARMGGGAFVFSRTGLVGVHLENNPQIYGNNRLTTNGSQINKSHTTKRTSMNFAPGERI
jgi:hypothetical protein